MKYVGSTINDKPQMINIFENDELSSPFIGRTTSTEMYAHGSIINPPRWRWTVGDGGSCKLYQYRLFGIWSPFQAHGSIIP